MLTKKDINKARRTLAKIGIDDTMVDYDAACILCSSTQAALAILAKRKELDKTGRETEPLIVLAGENHASPSHILHHMRVIDRIRKQEPETVVSLEIQHNFTKQLFERPRWFRKSQKLPQGMARAADDMTGILAFAQTHLSPFTRQLFHHNLLDKEIRFKFTDAAKNKDLLDLTDENTRASLNASVGPDMSSIKASSRSGLWIRNHFTTGAIKKLATESKARIIFHQCGAAHVTGGFGHKYNHSLTSIFNDNALPTLGYHLSHGEHLVSNASLIKLHDLPNKTAIYHTNVMSRYFNWVKADPSSTLNSPQYEAAYTNAVLAKMDMADHGLIVGQFIDQRKIYRQHTRQTFKQWRQDLRNTP